MSIQDATLIALTMVTYSLLRRFALRIGQLPARAYHRPSITIEACRRPMFILLAGTITLPIVLAAPRLGWSQFDEGRLLQIVIAAPVLGLAWVNWSYDTNGYFGREHLLDRGLVLLSGLLVVAHPAFVPLFVLIMIPVWRQVAHPRAIPDSTTDKMLPVDLLIALAAFLLLSAILTLAAIPLSLETRHFAIIAFALAGMHYFWAGWAKVRLGPHPWTWFWGNRLSDLTMNAWLYGHAQRIPLAQMKRIVVMMRPLNIPLQAMTLALELGAVLLLVDQRLAILILSGIVAMHLAILLASGIAFWKWIVVDLALIIFAAMASPGIAATVFSPGALACAVAIILLGRWHSSPAPLGWFDSPLVELFRYEAIGRDGRVYALPDTFFAPYDLAFCQGRLGCLCSNPRVPALVATHGNIRNRPGISAWQLRRLIDRTGGDPRRLTLLRKRYGVLPADPGQAEYFDEFIRRYLSHLEATARKRTFFSLVPHPRHFLHTPIRSPHAGDVYRMQSPIACLRVRYIEAFTDPNRFSVITDRIVREVDIPPRADIAGHIAPTGETAAAPRIADARAG